MKAIDILKKLITLYYYLIGLTLVGIIISPLFHVLGLGFSVTISGNKVNIFDLSLFKCCTIILLLGILVFIYFKAVQGIKKTLKDLSEGNYFSSNVINNFKKAGQYFLICGIIEMLSKVIFSFLLGYIKVSIDWSIAMFIIIGLFLRFLSEVFDKAKQLKTENDLTI